jgi:hypothetical protein
MTALSQKNYRFWLEMKLVSPRLGTKKGCSDRQKKHLKIRKNNACNGFLGVVG